MRPVLSLSALLLIVVVGALVLLGIGLNAPFEATAGIFGAPGDYDPGSAQLYRHISGLSCTPDDRAREGRLIDDAVAKAGFEAASAYADYKEVEVQNRAGKGELRERLLRAKRLEIDKEELFSQERRVKIGEWDAMRRFLDQSLGKTRAPLPSRGEILEAASKELQCPNNVDRVRNRVKLAISGKRITELQRGLERFRADTGRFPDAGDKGLEALLEKPEDVDLAAAWKGPYAEEADVLDGWGRRFQYVDFERGATCRLTSLGADGSEQGADENADLILELGADRPKPEEGARPE